MRIRSSGKFASRKDLYDDTADVDESTLTGALDASAEFVTQMIPALERSVDRRARPQDECVGSANACGSDP